MHTKNLAILPIEELTLIKGGRWIYDSMLDEWFWVETEDLDTKKTNSDLSFKGSLCH